MIDWHLVRTAAGRSATVAASLRASSLEGFTPLYESSVMVRDVAPRVRPLWPSWALARWDGDDAELWHRVHDTKFVAGIVGDALPTPIREAEVLRWLDRCDERWIVPASWLRANAAALVCPFVARDPTIGAAGDILQVMSGKLENLVGECIEVDRGPFEVMVTIESVMLGVDKVVSLPYSAFSLVYGGHQLSTPSRDVRVKRTRRGRRRWDDLRRARVINHLQPG